MENISCRVPALTITTCSNYLRILYFNARSLYPKYDELCALSEVEKPNIICITESWLHDGILPSECYIPGYTCVRCDRNKHGGGVALYISNDLEFQLLLHGPNELEFLLISVHSVNSPNQKTHIGLWYRLPANNDALDKLFLLLVKLGAGVFSNFVLIGDFNIDFYNQRHFLFSKLNSMLQSFELTQVVPHPTRTGTFPGSSTLIDLALLSEPSQLVNCEVIPPLGNSDHNGIDLTLKVAHKPPPVKTCKRTVCR